ncbi:MAG TPA: DUF1549 domain-containing protein, partial [Planctomycetaceae bacterium]|nr:DUF1549 domain-containing protein [Planctomycetaceae bacterium]
MSRWFTTILGLICVESLAPDLVWGQQNAHSIDFARDIRPIFSDICFKCHGPDSNQRQAELRLDREDSVREPREGHSLLVAGHPERSELFRRITSDAPDVRMPPPAQERQLTEQQIDSIKRWIEQGAEWKSHWSFEPPRRPALPAVSKPDWPRNETDYFILNRLDRAGLQPSLPADRRTLIRRVSLDLTGLPPTTEEVEDFLQDESPQAYERVIDRLLASPRYGEHMAGDWLDAARYADTSGYQNDGPREMWRWRDWVIDAFNENKPFDEFTIEQLAGDLLPKATLAQKIATGFNRNHRGNAEGGIIPEEFQVEYVVDRVETTSTVWLGLSLGCARCHDHKYDPFSQREFYRLFALFNNIPEHGRSIKEGNSPPYIKAPTEEQQQHLADLDKRLSELKKQTTQLEPKLLASLREWESNNTVSEETDWQPDFGLLADYSFDKEVSQFADGEPSFQDREQGRAVDLDGTTHLDLGNVANFGYFDKFSFSCWIKPGEVTQGTILSRMEDVPEGSGYSIRLIDGKVEVDLVKRWLDDSIRVETRSPVVEANNWTHLAVTYDGTRLAAGIRVFVDGRPVPLKVNLDYINQSFNADDSPLRLGAGHGPQDRYRGQLDDVRIYSRALTAEEASLLSEPNTITEILRTTPATRTLRQTTKLRNWYLAAHAPDAIRAVFEERDKLARE